MEPTDKGPRQNGFVATVARGKVHIDALGGSLLEDALHRRSGSRRDAVVRVQRKQRRSCAWLQELCNKGLQDRGRDSLASRSRTRHCCWRPRCSRRHGNSRRKKRSSSQTSSRARLSSCWSLRRASCFRRVHGASARMRETGLRFCGYKVIAWSPLQDDAAPLDSGNRLIFFSAGGPQDFRKFLDFGRARAQGFELGNTFFFRWRILRSAE